METQILNTLDDSRSNAAKMQNTNNLKGSEDVNNETHSTSNETFPNLSSRVYSDKFTVGNHSDNETKNIIHPDKKETWPMTQASSDISFDSNMIPSSPLSKALALASQSPISDINDDYFESLSQSPKSYAKKNGADTQYPMHNNSNNEIKLQERSVRMYRNDQSSISKDTLSAKEDSDQLITSNGVDSKVDNNLAGIVISSGPNGHFETFEGNGDNLYPHIAISETLLHAQSTTFQDELTLNLLDQQFRNDNVVPNLVDFISSDNLFYSNDITVSDASSEYISSSLNDLPTNSNTIDTSKRFSENFSSTVDASRNIDTSQNTVVHPIPSETSETNKHLHLAHEENLRNSKLHHSNDVNKTSLLSSTDKELYQSKTSIVNDQKFKYNEMNANFGNRIDKQRPVFTDYAISVPKDANNSNKLKIKLTKLSKNKRSLLLNSKINILNSTKGIEQKSLLKSKNQCKYDTELDDKILQNHTDFNKASHSLETDLQQPISTSTELVGSHRSVQSDVGNDDIPGKYFLEDSFIFFTNLALVILNILPVSQDITLTN